jgi:hypothetical protein
VRTQKRMAALTLSAASIIAVGPAFATSPATASTARHGAVATTSLLQRCRWVRDRYVCDYGRGYGRDRGRDYGRDRGRDRGRERGRDRGRERGRDWDRGRGRDRDRDWDED